MPDGGERADAGLPLTGVRVLDLSGRSGAYCSKILADFGADVVKVERPAGDRMRFLPPCRDGQTGPDAGLLFAYYHHNKRGITLDWTRDDAGPLLEALAGWADVVVASPRVSGNGWSASSRTHRRSPGCRVPCSRASLRRSG